ncbi:MAG: family 1 glycosylhydrolase [Actinomycetes bacterium]
MTDTSATASPLEFPEGFLWGTATAAHQIEGGNVNSDWWEFEHAPNTVVAEPSGDACDSWNRWSEDLDLVESMGLNAYRFSLEWARIEPEDGEFSMVALDHYKAICADARDRGILPVATFHHFTLPRWVAARGGFEGSDTAARFAEYVGRAANHLGDEIGMACTINEPNIVSMMGYVLGVFPPGVSLDFDRQKVVNDNFVTAHREAVSALRAAPGSYPIGLTLSMAEMVAHEGGEASRDEFREIMEDHFLRATEGDDFIGVQCYSRFHFGPNGFQAPEAGARMTPMGYEFWPDCVGATVRRAAEMTGLPVVVTENGISAADDAERIEYVTAALQSLHKAMADGIDVRGYVLWSLLDNFEWAFGYAQQFGLVEVDRSTFKRTPKPSASFYGAVARTGRLG